MSEQQSGMKEAFQYVRDVYRNCVRILLSADIIMEERQFFRYNWNHIYDIDPIEVVWRSGKILNLQNADSLMVGYLFHQYYEKDRRDKDIFSIYAAPWRRSAPESFQPACCATRFTATSTPDDVYWIGAMPIWEKKNVCDGKVREYDFNSALLSAQLQPKYDAIVSSEKKLLGVSVPLENIKSSADIEKLLVEPLFSNNL